MNNRGDISYVVQPDFTEAQLSAVNAIIKKMKTHDESHAPHPDKYVSILIKHHTHTVHYYLSYNTWKDADAHDSIRYNMDHLDDTYNIGKARKNLFKIEIDILRELFKKYIEENF